jgi:23S rRNA maturation-related 3'-5' exoribonuclease YhaM
MDKQDKYLNLITGLKSSNITSNIASLNTSSELIETFLSQSVEKINSDISKKNLNRSIEIIRQANNVQIDPNELINLYIKFGDIFKSVLSDLKREKIEYLNNVAVQYLNIAKQTKDTRIKNIAIAIAKSLNAE